jgi:RNA polymerase sigma-70 factor (ECF subfamily)
VNDESTHRRDWELAQRAAQGNERAWRDIYDESCQSLFNFLCYQVQDRDAALDLLQETYVVALRRIESYRGEGPLIGWLRKIALHKSLDWRRSLARRARRMVRFQTEAGASALDAPAVEQPPVSLRGEETIFRRALAALSPRQRAALLLHELEELPFDEVARSLGCSEATARVHFHRARLAMRRHLTEAGHPALADETGGLQA